MGLNISQSLEVHDYEVLIRKSGENEYSSYCPQLNFMLKGTVHEEVSDRMGKYIKEHIEKLSASNN